MLIQFSKLIPSPLFETDYSASEVWGRDFSFSGSERVLVSAASGKGKTTLLNIIIGKRTDYVGSVIIDGQNPLNFSVNERSILLSRKISMVHQGLSLFDELTLEQNIQLKNRITSFKTASEIDSMLEKLELTKQRRQKVRTLSYGQKQRLAIIRALCQPFGFLLLDEPFSHLDDNNALIAWQLIVDEAEDQKAGVVLTSLGNNFQMPFEKVYNL